MRVGIIQSAGIGDIIIALPIADYYLDRGAEVVWPIHEKLFPSFAAANPRVKWISVDAKPGVRYTTPRLLLEDMACDHAFSLYSRSHVNEWIQEPLLARSLKFDEYKYAVARVPFSEKWRLRLVRDAAREQALFDRLNITGPYVCVHDAGSNATANVTPGADWLNGQRLIHVEPLTDNPLDWLMVLERADRLIMLDSCLANAVEQLNFQQEKYLILRSNAQLTPVFKNGWRFIAPETLAD